MTPISLLLFASWLTDDSPVMVLWPEDLWSHSDTVTLPAWEHQPQTNINALGKTIQFSVAAQHSSLPDPATSSLRCKVETLNISNYLKLIQGNDNRNMHHYYWWEDKRETTLSSVEWMPVGHWTVEYTIHEDLGGGEYEEPADDVTLLNTELTASQ